MEYEPASEEAGGMRSSGPDRLALFLCHFFILFGSVGPPRAVYEAPVPY